MNDIYKTFQKKHDYLICVDSDGCVMDTMDIKHIRCFGPCMVREWQLEQWQDEILSRWNEINLYSMTRGVNRFKGLAKMLTEVNDKYVIIPGIEALNTWVQSGAAPSNDAVNEAFEKTGEEIFQKALSWSKTVNKSISELPEEVKKPFDGAKDALEMAHQCADVAIVSSANRDAVMEEWAKWGLLPNVDIMLAQDCGSKAECIHEMMRFGYTPDHVLMVGDAPGDMDAAKSNGVFYYPINVRHEKKSWDEFSSEVLSVFVSGRYESAEAAQISGFLQNLQN